MIRFLFAFVLVVAMACGGEGESVSDAVEGAANDVAARAGDAADTAMDAADSAMDSARDAASDAGDGVAQNCLGLVTDGKYAQAVPVCTEALGLDPSNTGVQQALDKAKSEAAKAALDGAAGDAAGALDKVPGLPGR